MNRRFSESMSPVLFSYSLTQDVPAAAVLMRDGCCGTAEAVRGSPDSSSMEVCRSVSGDYGLSKSISLAMSSTRCLCSLREASS